MIVFACIVCFMLGWLAHKAADMYDRINEVDSEKELYCPEECEVIREYKKRWQI